MSSRTSESIELERHSRASSSNDAAVLHADLALRESEQRFRQIAEAINHVFWVLELHPVRFVSYVSPAFERIWGRRADEFYADPQLWTNCLHPDDRAPVAQAFELWVQDPEHRRHAVEYRIVRPDGGLRWIADRAQVVRDDAQSIYRVTGVAEDITERKLAEQSAREERDRMARIAKVAPAILHSFRVGTDGRRSFTFGGERIAELYGMPWLDLSIDATPVLELMHDDDKPAFFAKMEESRRAMTPIRAEYRIRHSERGEVWVSLNSQPVNEPDGAICWQGTLADVTNRKRSQIALAQSEAQFEAVFANLAEGIVVFDPEGQMTHSNPAAAVMHDLATPLLPASLRGFIERFELRDAAGALIPVTQWPLSRILRGETLTDVEAHVHNLERGWVKVFNYAGSLVRGDDGQPRFGIVRLRDITAVKHAEDQIHQLNTQLEQRVQDRTTELEAAVKELEAFTYTVSHDLRAPLRALDGFSQAVLQDFSAQVPETGQRYLKIIRESAQKMAQLIDDLLAFSRVGRQPAKMRTVDNAMLVRNALQQLAPMHEGRQIELRIGALPPAQGDPALLNQVWVNLLSNALKYSRNSESAVIEVGVVAEVDRPVYFQDADKPVYFVRDNGVGFDMRYAHKLFGVFERLHRADEFEGTGVGLAIVQRIVQRHGGSVRAESAPGRGATFFFNLGKAVEGPNP